MSHYPSTHECGHIERSEEQTVNAPVIETHGVCILLYELMPHE